jgi:hypothetical protein
MVAERVREERERAFQVDQKRRQHAESYNTSVMMRQADDLLQRQQLAYVLCGHGRVMGRLKPAQERVIPACRQAEQDVISCYAYVVISCYYIKLFSMGFCASFLTM